MSKWIETTLTILSFYFLVFPAAAQATTLTKDSLPVEVRQTIRQLDLGCSSGNLNQAQINAGAVKKIDLNGDGYPDYLINDSYFPDGEHLTCRHGAHGGASIAILVGTADGRYSTSFSETVWAVKIVEEAHPVVRVLVGGGNCGQTGDFSFADSILCERDLVWDQEKKKFDFAPLSQAHLNPNTNEWKLK